MAKIDLHNFEAFLLDYLEGNLDEAGRAELKLFAITHPELEIDLENFDLPDSYRAVFDAEPLTFDTKEQLKKTEADLQNDDLLNYIEGNLDEAARKAIECKLLINKDLADELERYKKTVLKEDAGILFENKAALHKTEDDLLRNNRTIAYYENQLAAAERQAFELELASNENLAKELAALATTRLVADLSVVYPNKAELKKSAKVIALFNVRSVSAIAAAILLLFTLSFVFNYYAKEQVEPKPGLAKKQDRFIKPTITNTHSVQPANKVNVGETHHPHLNPGNLVAKKALPATYNITSHRADSLQYNELPNPIAEKRQQVPEPDVQDKKEESTEPALANTSKGVDKQEVSSSSDPASVAAVGQTHVLAVLEEVYDDEPELAVSNHKTGFWQKAARVAKQINHLGVKAVDGEEGSNKNYSLSFNSFSVEKH